MVRAIFFILLLSASLIACGGDVLSTPTVLPPATTSPPTSTQVTILPSPTATPEPTATPTLEPTTEPTLTPTTEPTVQPSPTVESPTLHLNIDRPVDGDEVVVGSKVTVSGQAPPAASPLTLQIEVASRQLVSSTVTVDETGTWVTELTIPLHVTGPGQLIVTTAAAADVASLSLNLLPDPDMPGLTLRRPGIEDTAVAGYTLLFEGRARRPINDTITIGVMVDDCTTFAVTQSFNVSGGIWQGFLVLPAEAIGSACAVAYTGTPGEGEWREARVPITILASSQPEAARIIVGNQAGATFAAGQTAFLYGIAVNAPNNQVQVIISQDDAQQTTLVEGTAPVDEFGFWEIGLELPENFTGPAVIIVNMGAGNNFVEVREPTQITP